MIARWLIPLIVFCSPLYLVRFSIFGIPTTLLEALIWAGFVWVLATHWKNVRTLQQWPLLWPMLLLLTGAIIATFYAPDHRSAFGLLKGYIVDPMVVAAMVWALREKIKITDVFGALIASGTIVALVSLVGRAFGWGVAPDGRLLGIYGENPNYLALFLGPIMAMGIIAMIMRRQRLWLALSTLVMLVALFLTGSRGAFLGVGSGLLLALVWWLWQHRGRPLATIATGAFITMIGLTLWLGARPDWSAAPDSGRFATSNNIRWEIWKATGALLRQAPILGAGLGAYQSKFTALTKERVNFPEFIAPLARTPHNMFLNYWAQTTILGLFAIIWMFALGLRALWRRSDPTSFMLVAALGALLAHSLVDAALWKNDLAVVGFILLTLATMPANQKQPN